MANRAVDLVITYRVIKLLVTPFNKQEAFKQGIIDKDGNVLKKYRTLKTTAEKKSYTILHRFVFNLKRILSKVGLGGRLGTFAVALATLLREDKRYEEHKSLIESAVITYLKDTEQYNTILKEEGDVMTSEPEQEVVSNCFGVDVYEVDNKLISEKEYAKTL
ncbi:hypothetical protein OAA21_00235 [bacterium]|nr:hypothetical protein [bacterium]|tara:strand:- start:220 stop:705 length:486 start_codon:yes stop_codon:yes gene_type:complete